MPSATTKQLCWCFQVIKIHMIPTVWKFGNGRNYYIYPLKQHIGRQLNSACMIKVRTYIVVVFNIEPLSAATTRLYSTLRLSSNRGTPASDISLPNTTTPYVIAIMSPQNRCISIMYSQCYTTVWCNIRPINVPSWRGSTDGRWIPFTNGQ